MLPSISDSNGKSLGKITETEGELISPFSANTLHSNDSFKSLVLSVSDKFTSRLEPLLIIVNELSLISKSSLRMSLKSYSLFISFTNDLRFNGGSSNAFVLFLIDFGVKPISCELSFGLANGFKGDLYDLLDDGVAFFCNFKGFGVDMSNCCLLGVKISLTIPDNSSSSNLTSSNDFFLI